MSKFEPLHKAHAIEQVQLSIKLAQPIGAAAIEKIRNSMNRFKGDDELPAHADLQTMVMSFGSAPIHGASQRLPPAGFVKSRVAPNGAILVQMMIESQGINFQTTEYSRWHEVWQECSKYLAVVVEAFLEFENVLHPLSISLNYVDKFIWMGNIQDCQPSQLLLVDSPYVCKQVYEKNDLWHSHTGEFHRIDDYSKRLVNLNIDCLDEVIDGHERRVIRMTTVLSNIFNQPSFKPKELPAHLILETLKNEFDLLHLKSKEFFMQTIAKSMCDRVALIAS